MDSFRAIMTWLGWARRSAQEAAGLLAPKTGYCAVCGGICSSRPDRECAKLPFAIRTSLCNGCLSTIPLLDAVVCAICGRASQCDDCSRRLKRYFICNRSAVEYSKTMREWLALYKYRGDERLAPLLAEMLAPVMETLSAEVLAAESARSGGMDQRRKIRRIQPHAAPAMCWDAIACVPISAERAEERGFNQAEQMAAYLARKYNCPLHPLLRRVRHTEKMSRKSRLERLRDARTLFEADHKSLLALLERCPSNRPPRILLVDDIYTTGSTAQGCSSALHRQSDRRLDIYVLTWARS